jgi:ornithine carbamoyltransferase
MKHYLQFSDFTADEYAYLLERAALIKKKFKNYEAPHADRPHLAMIFEKASTRTRVSFEAGMYQLGGSVVHLTTGDSQLGRAEPIEDSARVISRMTDLVMIRTFGRTRSSALPPLARARHQRPDQRVPPLPDPGRHLHLHRAPRLDQGQGRGLGGRRQQHGQHLAAGGRSAGLHGPCQHGGYEVDEKLAFNGKPVNPCYKVFKDPLEACKGADLVTTDVWTSMGYEAENEARKKAFADWCVDAEMMAAAKADALFMHCLPAHRGEEVEAEVIDGPQSVVWDEAENRMHVQKALMEYLLLVAPD